MFNPVSLEKVYTPEQVADLLQLNKATIYELINKGEIIAKRIGKVYRIPATSLAFIFTGLDMDLYQADQEDRRNLQKVEDALAETRSRLP